MRALADASSETQGQLVGAGKSLNGRGKIRPNFFLARLDFFPPPLTAPGSPRMLLRRFSARTRIAKTNMPLIQRSFDLLGACSIFAIFFVIERSALMALVFYNKGSYKLADF